MHDLEGCLDVLVKVLTITLDVKSWAAGFLADVAFVCKTHQMTGCLPYALASFLGENGDEVFFVKTLTQSYLTCGLPKSIHVPRDDWKDVLLSMASFYTDLNLG